MTFKVGDKVIIRNLDKTARHWGTNHYMMGLVGKELTIDQITYEGENEFGVRFNEQPNHNTWSYHPDDLELVEEDTVQEDTSYEDEFWEEFFSRFTDEGEELEEDELEEEDEEYISQQVILIITEDSVTLTLEGNTDIATEDHPSFEDIVELAKEGKYLQAQALMNVSTGITNWGTGLLSIDGDTVVYAGMTLTGKLVDKIIGMMGKGDEEFERFAKFLNLVMEQQSFQTRERLMDFVAAEEIKLTKDGHVIAFKNVRDDYYDKHSRTFLNKVGESPSMPRNMVDDNHNNTCSNGLHVCSPEYLRGFWGTSGRTMKVVVNPKNFVAIPPDYNDSKARVSEYLVVEDVTDNIKEYL